MKGGGLRALVKGSVHRSEAKKEQEPNETHKSIKIEKRMHFFISLVMVFPLAAWCAPNPQGGTTPTTATTKPSPSSSSSQSPSPTPARNLVPVGAALTTQGKQEAIRTSFMNHDNGNISATVEFKCNPTQSSPQLKDVEALSGHYLTKSTPLITLPSGGGAGSCVPLEEKKDVSAAKLEACSNDTKIMYPEVGRVLQMLQGYCAKDIDGTKFVGGSMEFTAMGKVTFSIKVNTA
ncbi:unnamed protein product [Tuber aestivum]|uniref:Uncharacterized protein n=1 Tax=Tuber aestivum TaxID=59557 RepID=A0A292Q0T5_9PEZI|nr:unnamed protein product [Tuber aestivum]